MVGINYRSQFDRVRVAAPTAVLVGVLALALASCGRGRSVPGLERIRADVLQKTLYVSFVATSLQWDAGVTLPVPGLPQALLGVAPDLVSSGTVFQFSVPLASLVQLGRPAPLGGLPDGRSLPDVSGGVLPRWDFRLDRLVVSAYLSTEVFGLFIPLELKSKLGTALFSMISMEIADERGNRVGKVYAIPNSIGGTGSGVLVLLPFIGGGAE